MDSPMPQESSSASVPAGETFVEGLVYPPPAIREIADKTAAHIGKRGDDGPQLEQKIREKGAARFSFINPTDPYYPYYQHRLKLVKSGADVGATNSGAKQAEIAKEVDDGRPKVPQPPPFEFLLETPRADPVDLDIIKLTALFVARSGRRFQTEIAERERSNYQFEFLRPGHSLFNYFNVLVDQYAKVMQPDADKLAKLSNQAGYGGPLGRKINDELDGQKQRTMLGRRETMKDIKDRVTWAKWEAEQIKKKEDEDEALRIAFAEIDWQDFVVAATIEFTEQDDAVELPAPLTLHEVANRSLKEKRKLGLVLEGKDAADDLEADEDAIMAAAQAVTDAALLNGFDADVNGGEAEEEEAAPVSKETDQIKVQTADATAAKIRPSGYVPRSKRHAKQKTSPCSICGQQIPVDEYAEHVRIELLDPKWKEKQARTDANRSASNMLSTGADISASLRNLAGKRTDIFSGAGQSEAEKRKAAEAEALRKAKARESVVWDGHLASSQLTTDRFITPSSFDNQIEAIHRAKGLKETNEEPKIGPSVSGIQPASSASSAQPAPVVGSGSVISAAPGPAVAAAPPAFIPPPPQFGGMPTFSTGPPTSGFMPLPPPGVVVPPGVVGPPPGVVLPPGVVGPPPGVTRPADEPADGEPSAKRAKVEQLYDEATWLASHPDPVDIVVQLPVYPDKPEWQLQGQTLTLESVPLTALAGTLRERIQAKLGIPLGRQQFKYRERILANTNTLASYNVDNKAEITLVIKDARKR